MQATCFSIRVGHFQDRLMGACHEEPGSHTDPAGPQLPSRVTTGLDNKELHRKHRWGGWLWDNVAKIGMCGGCGCGKPDIPLRTMPFRGRFLSSLA